TSLVLDINPTGDSLATSYLAPDAWPGAVMGGFYYFRADDGVHGYELWRSNGTTSGTTLVKDVNPGAAGSGPTLAPSLMVVVGKKLFFFAFLAGQGQLWASDGTTAGTYLVRAFKVRDEQGLMMVAFQGELLFDADGDSYFRQLWRSNGTAAGTTRVTSFAGG